MTSRFHPTQQNESIMWKSSARGKRRKILYPVSVIEITSHSLELSGVPPKQKKCHLRYFVSAVTSDASVDILINFFKLHDLDPQKCREFPAINRTKFFFIVVPETKAAVFQGPCILSEDVCII